jgi:O-antigen/teichoic acid export membrane protein
MLKRVGNIFETARSHKVIAAGVSTLLIKVGSAGLSYLMFVLIANAISPEDYGRFGIGFALAITLGNIAALGTSTSLLRFLPQYQSTNRPDLAKGYFLDTSRAVAGFALLIALCIGLVAYVSQQYYGPAQSNYLFAAAALTLIVTFTDYVSHALRGLGSISLSQLPKDVVWRAIVCVFALASAVYGYHQNGTTVLVFCFVSLAMVTLVQLVASLGTFGKLLAVSETARDRAGWVKTMLPIWGVVSLTALVQQFDVVVLGIMGRADEGGAYFAALRTASLLSMLLLAGNLAAAPLMSSLYHSGDRAGLVRMVRLISAAIGFPTLVGLIFLMFTGTWLLRLFDPMFVSAYWILIILGCGFAGEAAAGPSAYLLQMTGHERTYLKILATSYGLVIVAQLVFVPLYGLWGAAVPSALGLLFTGVATAFATRKTLGVDPSIIGVFRKS